MGLRVNNLSNDYIYSNYQAKAKSNNGMSDSSISMGGDTFHTSHDKSCDGKFSFSQALKNFGEGLVSPITSMFSSPKNFIVGAGLIVGSMALVAATGGAAAPLLVVAGVAMGTVQAGEAVYKLAKAKNGDDVEKAFYEVGSATSTLGLSVLGAKGSLKQASIETESLNPLTAVKKCFTSAKDLASESYEVFKSGYYKKNLSEIIRTIRQPNSLKKYSRELYQEGIESFDASFNALRDALPEDLRPILKGRAKSETGIYAKMVKERTTVIDDRIRKIQENPAYSDEIKQQKIAKLNAERELMGKDGNFAKGKIEDLLGARLVLDDVSPENIEKLVSSLISALEKGDIDITEIENYRGASENYTNSNDFYFSKEQIERIKEASGNAAIRYCKKPSGYTAVQLKVKPKNGKIIELQIRGKKIDEFADIEHLQYDARQGKNNANGNNEAGIILSNIDKAMKKLNPEQYAKYQKYIYDHYMHAQALELGKSTVKPVLPEGIDNSLSVDSLKALYEKTHHLPHSIVKTPFVLSTISGTEGFNTES